MTSLSLRSRLRHPVAAVLGVAGVLAASVAVTGSPAAAAADELVSTTTFSCQISTFPAYSWDGEITLSAVRPADSTTVTVTASLSQMAGKSPARINDDFTNELRLTLGGAPVTLTGSGHVEAAPNAPFDMPDLTGTFTSSADDLAAVVTGYYFSIPRYAMNGVCTPTANADLGSLTVVEGAPPTASPTPTTTTSATATPSASPSATEPAPSGGTPAKGKATFACTLTIGSEFDYEATISVAGYRAEEGDDVSLVATMSDLPGIAPVPIDGSMDYTLEGDVGGEDATLTSTDDVSAAPMEEVAVADLAGSVAADGDEMEVAVSSFAFDFPSAGIGAECTSPRTVLGTMVVGSEPIAVESPGGGDDSGGGTGGSAGGELPKTGGADSLPVVGLWALALTLLGAAGLLCVPRARRTH
ncbi:hypothetical protein [Nocardioides sp. cx-173]|uniref:hypothetical protein n=1 Tax=Nocardioides sp. cx-173 TaxID=2898796 RepID=UPI001E2B1BBF|nr:hypothetical protein [Nocardioides sp. cx-173]MCD4524379.1 hypothetical protein [Nocardioides sp. cx-173]UGB43133.1 hypothetical protein LQ940_06300 [Nocardioides sp. cx-173]